MTRAASMTLAMSAFSPIVLKKSKMQRQQNLRGSKQIADFGWRCPLRGCGKAAE
jgi:hypothetical protein